MFCIEKNSSSNQRADGCPTDDRVAKNIRFLWLFHFRVPSFFALKIERSQKLFLRNEWTYDCDQQRILVLKKANPI